MILPVVRYLREMNPAMIREFTTLKFFVTSMTIIWMTTCTSSPQPTATGTPLLSGEQEAISFLGDTMVRPLLDTASKHRADSLMEEALTLYKEDSTDLNAIIWYGRRQAYLHRYRDAIQTYSRGIQLHPQSPELLRHRGHRHITTRQLDHAIADLELAATLAKNRNPEIEPDGIPNKLDIPLSNLHFNIYYHLGLAYYLKAEYQKAIDAFNTCMTYSDNPDLKVATTYWLYLSNLRHGAPDPAAMLLTDISPDMEIIENAAYLGQLLFFKTGDMLVSGSSPGTDSLPIASTHYGISCWYDLHGQKGKAADIRKQILSSDSWPLFGYIAAEADSSRLFIQ
jgi:tetratricopeptide (TPR) repeat protein